jgi:hypothetical protein
MQTHMYVWNAADGVDVIFRKKPTRERGATDGGLKIEVCLFLFGLVVEEARILCVRGELELFVFAR